MDKKYQGYREENKENSAQALDAATFRENQENKVFQKPRGEEFQGRSGQPY